MLEPTAVSMTLPAYAKLLQLHEYGQSRMFVIVRYALTTLLNQGSSGNYSACKARPFAQCADAERRAFLCFFIVKFACVQVLGSAQDASANARHEKKRSGCIMFKQLNQQLKRLILPYQSIFEVDFRVHGAMLRQSAA